MKFFAWSDALSVGVPIIDADHRRLIELINELHDATAPVPPRRPDFEGRAQPSTRSTEEAGPKASRTATSEGTFFGGRRAADRDGGDGGEPSQPPSTGGEPEASRAADVESAEVRGGAPAQAAILKDLFGYAEQHFAREEALMDAAGYPALAIHRRSHQSFVEDLRRRARRPSRPGALVGYLKTWLSQHILVQDMAYRPYMVGREVDEARQRLDAFAADDRAGQEPPHDLERLVEERTRDLLRANAELEAAANAAEAASRAKSAFIASMSHELRTPLHAILSLSRLGIDKTAVGPRERLKAYFTDIRISGERLLTLFDNLLDLARLEAGRMTFEFRPTDLYAIATKVVREFAVLAEEKEIRVEAPAPVACLPAAEAGNAKRQVDGVPEVDAQGPVDRAPVVEAEIIERQVDGLPGVEAKSLIDRAPVVEAWILGDEVRLAQVLRNLLANATRHVGRGGHVTVRIFAPPAPDRTATPAAHDGETSGERPHEGPAAADAASGRATPDDREPAPEIDPETGHEEMMKGRAARGMFELWVEDNGPGVPEADLERIFEPFQQGTAQGAGGAGLGLSICREIVAAHEGQIHAELRQGGGTRFVVCLPARSTEVSDER